MAAYEEARATGMVSRKKGAPEKLRIRASRTRAGSTPDRSSRPRPDAYHHSAADAAEAAATLDA